VGPNAGDPATSQTFNFHAIAAPNAVHTLYLWSTVGTPASNVSPATASTATAWPTDKPPTTAYSSYYLGVTGTLASMTLTHADILNPNIYDGSSAVVSRDTDWNPANGTAQVLRWGAVSSFTNTDPGNTHVTASAITGLNATTLPV